MDIITKYSILNKIHCSYLNSTFYIFHIIIFICISKIFYRNKYFWIIIWKLYIWKIQLIIIFSLFWFMSFILTWIIVLDEIIIAQFICIGVIIMFYLIFMFSWIYWLLYLKQNYFKTILKILLKNRLILELKII